MNARDLGPALTCIAEGFETGRVLGNDLSKSALVGVKRGDCYQAVYPPSASGAVSL